MIWKTETRLIQSRRPLPSVLSWSMTRESKCPRNSVSSPIKQWHPIPSSIPIGWKKKVCLLWEIFLIRWKLCQVHNVLYAKLLAFKKKFVCICCCLKYGNRQPLTLAMLKVRFGVRLIVFELFPAMSTVSLLKMLIQNNWCSLGKTLIAQSGWRWETNCLLSSMSVISCTHWRGKCQNLTAFLLCDCQFFLKKIHLYC